MSEGEEMSTVELVIIIPVLFILVCISAGFAALTLATFWEAWKEFKGLRDLKWRLPK